MTGTWRTSLALLLAAACGVLCWRGLTTEAESAIELPSNPIEASRTRDGVESHLEGGRPAVRQLSTSLPDPMLGESAVLAPARLDLVLELEDDLESEPMEGAALTLVNRSEVGTLLGLPLVHTDADGRASWTQVPPGSYWLGALGLGRRSVRLDSGENHLVWKVRGVDEITGTVLSEGGRPVAGAGIWVSEAGNPAVGATVTYSGPAGEYALRTGLTTPRFIGVHARDYALTPLKMLLPDHGADGRGQRHDFVLSRTGLAVGGEIIDDRGKPIVGAVVRLDVKNVPGILDRDGTPQPARNCASTTARTNAQGRFEFESLVPRVSFSLDVRAEGYAQRTVESARIEDGWVRVVLVPEALVRGVVQASDGSSLRDGQVLLKASRAAAPPVIVFTDARGRFEISALDRGRYTLTAVAQGFQRAVRELELEAAGRLELELLLGPKEGSEIRGVIAPARPDSGEDWLLWARWGDDERPVRSVRGRFRLEHWPWPRVDISVAHPALPSSSRSLGSGPFDISQPIYLQAPDDLCGPAFEVRGRVREVTGAVGARFLVSARVPGSGSSVATCTTDGEGQFVLGLPFPCAWILTVSTEGLVPVSTFSLEAWQASDSDLGVLEVGGVTQLCFDLSRTSRSSARYRILNASGGEGRTGIAAGDTCLALPAREYIVLVDGGAGTEVHRIGGRHGASTTVEIGRAIQRGRLRLIPGGAGSPRNDLQPDGRGTGSYIRVCRGAEVVFGEHLGRLEELQLLLEPGRYRVERWEAAMLVDSLDRDVRASEESEVHLY